MLWQATDFLGRPLTVLRQATDFLDRLLTVLRQATDCSYAGY